MGFLDRMLGRPAPDQQMSLEAVDATGETRVAVVGESHYQRELAAIAGPKRVRGVQVGVRAVLVPEPDNEYDRNAVAIYVNGRGKVGYLGRDDAVRYKPIVSAS